MRKRILSALLTCALVVGVLATALPVSAQSIDPPAPSSQPTSSGEAPSSMPASSPGDSSSLPVQENTPASSSQSTPSSSEQPSSSLPASTSSEVLPSSSSASASSSSASSEDTLEPAPFNLPGLSVTITGVTPNALQSLVEAYLVANASQTPGSYDYSGITEITISGTLDYWDFRFIRGSLSNIKTIDLSGINNTSIPALSFFYNPSSQVINALTTVILSPTITEIERAAFINNSLLQNINLENITTIGTSAFSHCSNLGAVNLSNLTSIKVSPFVKQSF